MRDSTMVLDQKTADVKALFDKYADQYDSTRRLLIPCFDEFYGACVSVLADNLLDNARVLDLGAGSGLLSRILAAHLPIRDVHLVDVSEKMLSQAASHGVFSSLNLTTSVLDLSRPEQLSGSYDAIVSSLAIHHLTQLEKQQLYQHLPRLLKPGGVFLNADQVLGPTPELENKYRLHWRATVEKSPISQGDLDAALDRMRADKMDTLELQLDALRSAGLVNVDCWYKNYSFCVFGGEKTQS